MLEKIDALVKLFNHYEICTIVSSNQKIFYQNALLSRESYFMNIEESTSEMFHLEVTRIISMYRQLSRNDRTVLKIAPRLFVKRSLYLWKNLPAILCTRKIL